ncbi:hypothetical protein [Salegentibacter mishustinae]|uniref:hypothetical protein n=1 Tax=Salegentibacter mishustinae TaxID=270918 RepID=UPI00248FD8A3|nr:hypothetical protein [Salegentibacter mishustinae]
MNIKKEVYNEVFDPTEWSSNGFDKKGNLIWSLEYRSESNILYSRSCKIFITYKYDDKGNISEKFIEECDWEEDNWYVDSITQYDYDEHAYGDQLKVKEIEYAVNTHTPRKIIVKQADIILPEPLYPENKNYEIIGKRRETKVKWLGNLFEKYIKTISYSGNGKISNINEKIHEQEGLDVLISHKLNGEVYSEEEYLYEDTFSSIILVKEKKWIENEHENYSSSTVYEYDNDKLVKSLQELIFYDEDDFEKLELRKTITIRYLNGKPIKKKEEEINSITFTDYEYNNEGKLTSFILSEIKSGNFQEKKYQVSIKSVNKELIKIHLLCFDPNDKISFDLNNFIDLPNEFYAMDIFSELEIRNDEGKITRSRRYLESNSLEISIHYELNHISEIILSDLKTNTILKKNIFLNNFILDQKAEPHLKSITGLAIDKNYETFTLFKKRFDYYK